ncbi:uncharacterized protein LOC105793180 [Gossypium raimondii]|uniref:uncharacterized protein LOC105793180 n=1 Tax=Gossypium raimondii TaxID=29730 RepID=UPI00063AFFCC|nr:uncharacterized protein LOC105793180 [Gossypium raimondii]
MEEFRAQTYESAKLYKEKTKCWHDKRIMPRQFEPGQHVLFFNSRLKIFPSKLKSCWSGSFEVAKVYPHGAVDVKDIQTGITLKVSGQLYRFYKNYKENPEKGKAVEEEPEKTKSVNTGGKEEEQNGTTPTLVP